MIPMIRTTGQAVAAGAVLGAVPVGLVHYPIFKNDYKSGHVGQPKAIPTALATMVGGVGGLSGGAMAIRSNSGHIRLGAALQGAGASFTFVGAAAVLGYLMFDSRAHVHPPAVPAVPAPAPGAPAATPTAPVPAPAVPAPAAPAARP